jgi:UDP-N-acetyl-D-mannosaminuronate dehydrogenase
MIELLRAEEANVVVCDPYFESPDLESAVADADAIVLATNHAAFRDLPFLDTIRRSDPPPILVDCWGIWDEEHLKAANIELIAFGKGDNG